MVQYYTLEEAAKLLHTTVDKLKEMARNGEVRPFQDRGNLRFRSQEINELVRAKGFGSDPELILGDVGAPSSKPASSKSGSGGSKSKPPEDAGAVFDFALSTDESGVVPLGSDLPLGSSKSGAPPSSSSRRKNPTSSAKSPPPVVASDSDVRLVAEGSDLDFKIAEESYKSPSPAKKGSSKSKPGVPPHPDSEVRLAPSDKGADSDVRLVGEGPAPQSVIGQPSTKKPSDSDVRMERGDLPAPSSRRLRREVITEEIDLDEEFKKAEEMARAKGGQPPAPKTIALPKTGGQAPPEPIDQAKAGGPRTPSRTAGPKSSPKPAPKPGPKSAPKSGPKSGPAAKQSKEDESSEEFTLAPVPQEGSSGEVSPLEPTSDESLLLGEEEVSLGELSGATGGSGINLQSPADSGISLEQGGSDEIEFELSLDPADAAKGPKTSVGPKTNIKKDKQDKDEPSDFELSLKEDSDSEVEASSDSEFELTLDGEESVESPTAKAPESDSDSEFELTLDDRGSSGKLRPEDEAGGLAGDEEKDIFETDFEVPSAEGSGSGSEAMALDSDTDVETSDFDLSSGSGESGIGSQVVELDDDSADAGAATVKRPAKRRKAAISDEAEVETDAEELLDKEEEEETRTVTVAAPPAEWGPLPALVLLPAVIVLFFVSLMGFELVHGMWGYNRGSRVSGLIIDPIARMLDDSLPKGD